MHLTPRMSKDLESGRWESMQTDACDDSMTSLTKLQTTRRYKIYISFSVTEEDRKFLKACLYDSVQSITFSVLFLHPYPIFFSPSLRTRKTSKALCKFTLFNFPPLHGKMSFLYCSSYQRSMRLWDTRSPYASRVCSTKEKETKELNYVWLL